MSVGEKSGGERTVHSSGMGARIREARDAAGLSRRELAAMLGCTRKAVELWEYGVRDMNSRYLPALAAATGKPLSWFFGGEAA